MKNPFSSIAVLVLSLMAGPQTFSAVIDQTDADLRAPEVQKYFPTPENNEVLIEVLKVSQSTAPQSCSNGCPHLLGFLRRPAMRDDIMSVSLKWHLRVMRRQPSVECVMQKQVSQQGAEPALSCE